MNSAVQWQFDTIRDDAAKFGERGVRQFRTLSQEVAQAAADSDDTALRVRLQASDETALDLVFERYLAPLVRFASALLATQDDAAADASDVVSDVLVSLWDHRAGLASVNNLRAYLYRAVHHRALNRRRSAQRGRERYAGLAAAGEVPGMAAPVRAADEQLEADERGRIVWMTVHAMREPTRTVAILRWSHGLGFTDIGEISGISAAAARVYAGRALSMLRATIPDLLR